MRISWALCFYFVFQSEICLLISTTRKMLHELHFPGAAVLLCLVISCARASAQGNAMMTNVAVADVAKELANM